MNAVKAVVAAVLLSAAVCGSANADVTRADAPPTLSRTQEHRLWSAEQWIKRLTEMFAKSLGACKQNADWMPRLAEQCTAAVVAAYPILTTIREIASSGDEVRWAAIVDVVHKLEAETAANLQMLERR
jgi:hypothetical protein